MVKKKQNKLEEEFVEFESMVRYHLVNNYDINPMLAHDMMKMSGLREKFFHTPSLYLNSSPIKVAGLIAIKYEQTHKN